MARLGMSLHPVLYLTLFVLCFHRYGPGLKKQRLCVPCPTGFSTAGKILQTRPMSCGTCVLQVQTSLRCCQELWQHTMLLSYGLLPWQHGSISAVNLAACCAMMPGLLSPLPHFFVLPCSRPCWLLSQGSWSGGTLPQGRVEGWLQQQRQLYQVCLWRDHCERGLYLRVRV